MVSFTTTELCIKCRIKHKYLRPEETLEMWYGRVSGGGKEVRELIAAQEFLFGSFVLSTGGTDTTANLNSCYLALKER